MTGGVPQLQQETLRRLTLPAYSVALTSRLTGNHRTTINGWYRGYRTASGNRSPRVLGQREKGVRLSYLQLIEVAMVATMRGVGVSLERLRIAHRVLSEKFGKEYPFAELRLKTDGAHIMKDMEKEEGSWVDCLLVASQHAQIAWADPIRERIREFNYDEILRIATRWYPRGISGPVIIDPLISFGAPITRIGSIPTAVIGGRFMAKEDVGDIASDFGIPAEMVWGALEFEGIPFSAIA